MYMYVYMQAHRPNLYRQTRRKVVSKSKKQLTKNIIYQEYMCMYICVCGFVILRSGISKIIFRVRKRRSVFCPLHGADTFIHTHHTCTHSNTYIHTYIHVRSFICVCKLLLHTNCAYLGIEIGLTTLFYFPL